MSEPCLHTLMQTLLWANQSARTILISYFIKRNISIYNIRIILWDTIRRCKNKSPGIDLLKRYYSPIMHCPQYNLFSPKRLLNHCLTFFLGDIKSSLGELKTMFKTLFTWSGGLRSSGVSFFCFVSPRA